MKIIERINLDLAGRNANVPVNAKQGDAETRAVCITLTHNGLPYQPPAGATAGFRCLKPDGCSCDNPAVINSDGTVTVELTQQVLAVPGRVWADVYLNGTEGELLSSASFQINVEFVPRGKHLDSTNEFLALGARIAAAVAEYLKQHPIIPDGSGALNGEATALLVSILRSGVYTSAQAASIDALENALRTSESGGTAEITVTMVGSTLVIGGIAGVNGASMTGTRLVLE